MANLPETPVFDAGVYQIETADPVVGGPDGTTNAPLKNLANRTRYLKQHVDALEAGEMIPPTVAPLNSPTFTGSPTAPTPAAGADTTGLATTAFVQNRMRAVLTKSVAGSGQVTLTAAEAASRVIILTGALTGSRTIVFPDRGDWIVRNSTTGNHALTCKTASGNGIQIQQGMSNHLAGEGANIILADTPVSSFVDAGTRMVFYQAAAPVGWTQVTSVNDRVLRVVSGEGGAIGGNWEISGLSASVNVGNHTLSTSRIPSHSHDYVDRGSGAEGTIASGASRGDSTRTTSSTGGGGAHSHSASASVSHDGTWRPAYADVIVAAKD